MDDQNSNAPQRSLAIRDAAPIDSDDAQRIVFGILRSYGIEPDPDHLDRDVVNFGSNNPAIVREFSATKSDKLVGVCTLKIEGDSRCPLVTALFVDPDARGLGIGKALLNHAIVEARRLGFSRLSLETRELFKEAVKLYESTGWKRGKDLPPGYGPDRTYYLDL